LSRQTLSRGQRKDLNKQSTNNFDDLVI